MRMRIQTREYELTVEINELRMGEMREVSENIIGLTNGFDGITFHCDSAVPEDMELRIHSDDHSIVYYDDEPLTLLTYYYFHFSLCSLQVCCYNYFNSVQFLGKGLGEMSMLSQRLSSCLLISSTCNIVARFSLISSISSNGA